MFSQSKTFPGEIKSSLHDDKCVFVNGFNLKLSSAPYPSFMFAIPFLVIVIEIPPVNQDVAAAQGRIQVQKKDNEKG